MKATSLVHRRKQYRIVLASVVTLFLLPVVGTPSEVPHAASIVWPSLDSTQIPLPTGSGPWGVAFNPVNGYLYVSDTSSFNVSVINTSTNQIVTQIPVIPGNEPIVADTATGYVYVGSAWTTVSVISPVTNRVVATVSIPASAGCSGGCFPQVQAYDSANGDVYVSQIDSPNNNNVSVIHNTSLVTTIPVGSGPNGAVYDPADGNIFVANEGSLNLTIINGSTNRVVGQVAVWPGPGLAYDSSNKEVYVCSNAIENGQSNFVTAVNGTTDKVVATVSVGTACGGALYDSANDYLYITDNSRPGYGGNLANVTVIDPETNRVVLTLPVGSYPQGIAYDPLNNNIYVANAEADTISILPQIYRLTVHESGLPSGANWSISVGNVTLSSTTSTISFPEPAGTFAFSVPPVQNESATPSSGTVTIISASPSIDVTFGKGGGAGFLGLPGASGYFLLGGIAIAVGIVAAVVVIHRRRLKRQR